jgi:hypothetical protein
MRQGKGIWKGVSMDNLYVGDWKKNRADGYGTYTWPNGKLNYSLANEF